MRKVLTLAASLAVLTGISVTAPTQAYAWTDPCAGRASLIYYVPGGGEIYLENRCGHYEGFKVDIRAAAGLQYCPDELLYVLAYSSIRHPYSHDNCRLHDVK